MAGYWDIYNNYKNFMARGGATRQAAPVGPADAGKSSGSGGGGGGGSYSGPRGQSPLDWAIDMVSRPMFAVTGAVNQRFKNAGTSALKSAVRVAQGKSTKNEEILSAALKGLSPLLTDNKGMAEAAWKGLTSTDPKDKVYGVDIYDNVASMLDKDYKPPVSDGPGREKVEKGSAEAKERLGADLHSIIRGAVGFGTDVALDPLTYGTLGVGKALNYGMRAARASGAQSRVANAIKRAEQSSAAGAKTERAAAPTTRAEAAVDAPTPQAVDETAFRAPGPDSAPSGVLSDADLFNATQRPGNRLPSTGATNVAGSLSTAARQIDGGSTFARVTNANKATAPKVSETLGRHSSGVVEALLKTRQAVEKAASSPATAAKAAKAVKTAAAPKSMGDFAKQFFGDADTAVARLSAGRGTAPQNIFPANIVKNLSGNPQAAQTFYRRLVAAANDPASATPQLREFLRASRAWQEEQKLARSAAGGGGLSGAPASASQAVDNAVQTPTRELLRSILKTPSGKPTAAGKELRAALGPKLFQQLTSKRTNEATRTQVFDELTTLAKDADSVSPTTFDGMHENVRNFVEDTLQLRREDFDQVSRQKMLDEGAYSATPKVYDRKTARSIDPQTMQGAQAATGLSAREMANRFDAQAARIVGDQFDPRKGHWEGGNFNFKTADGRRYVIEDGNIGTHAFTTWADGARKAIDDAIPPATSGFYKGRVPPQAKTAARREQLPAALREVEEALEASGVPMAVKLGDETVPMRPSHIHDAVGDAQAALRVDGVSSAGAQALEKRADVLLYNPGTAVPDSLMYEAVAAAIRGKADDEILDILGRTKSVYNGVPIKRQPLGTDRKGGRYLRTEYSSEQLRGMALDFVRRIAPHVQQRGAGAAREFAEKSITDASAIASKLEIEGAEAAARGAGPAYEFYADLEKRVVELAREYGASGHAIGLAAEELSKQLPPWLVQQAKAVRSTQTAYTNAARAGKSMDDMRKMGAVSEARHTPVEMQAVADDMSVFLDDAAEKAAEAGEKVYAIGDKATSVLRAEMETAGLLSRMRDGAGRFFDTSYGTSFDDIRFMEYDRMAAGMAGKPIVTVGNEINAWGKKHMMPILAPDGTPTKETVGSAAFKLMQEGVEEVPEEMLRRSHGAHLKEAFDDLKPIAEYFFDVPGSRFAGDKYWRSGAKNVRYLEEEMARAGLKYDEVFEKAALDGDVTAWWRNAEVDNPTEFLHRYNEAVHRAEARRASMVMLTERLKSSGLMSEKAKPGFAKPTLSGESFFYAGLQDSGMYIDKVVLEAMSEADKLLTASRGFSEKGVISQVFDPVLSAWKTGMTIMRPGHHVRNTVSNGMLSFVDQGVRNFAKSGSEALQLMAMREGSRGTSSLAAAERLLSGAESGLKSGKGSAVVYSTKLPSGKKLEITRDMFNDAFERRGFFRTYQQSEDIVQGAGRVQKFADMVALKNTKVGKAAGALSESLDHHGYLQHAMQIVMNNAHLVGRKYKSLDDLFDYATTRSYRFHPDSHVLTPTEAKTMRRLFGFYTWFKGTLPAVVSSTIRHPGRVAVAHKASFNAAQAFGIDAESYANPWPEDAEVPDYMQEGVFGANFAIGGQMYSLNPGFAHQDLARMFFGRGSEVEEEGETGNFGAATLSNAGRELLGMLNPMILAPIELAAGQRLQSGRKIYSGGDYIDETLPYVNYLTSGSGISFMDNLLDIPGAIRQGRPHERSQVDRGYQPSLFEEGVGESQHRKVLNWLFGQSAQLVETKEQAAASKLARDARLAAREGEDPAAAPTEASSAVSGAAGAGSGDDATIEELLATLDLPDPAKIDAPAQLDVGSVAAIEEVLRGMNPKPLTASQRLSAAKAMQQDALRQQSATNWTGYATSNLEALQERNPTLSLSQLLALAKHLYPNQYE